MKPKKYKNKTYQDRLDLLDRFVRSQNKWHMTSLLFAEKLKEAGVDPAWVDKVMEASKDETAHMLIDYMREHGTVNSND